MKKNNVKLVDNNLTGDELINIVKIGKTNRSDFDKIANIVAKAFNLESDFDAVIQLENENMFIDESVKLFNPETGEIYGILILCDYPITFGTPIYDKNRKLAKYLDGFKQIGGHSFVIDERLRKFNLDRKMLLFNYKFMSENYDFIWCGVESWLNTKNYWLRHGFINILNDNDASFFIYPFNKKISDDIYNKCDIGNEDIYSKRK